MLLALPADKILNQPPLAVQLKTATLLQQDLTRVPKTLLMPVPLKSLIIQNVVQKKPRRRSKSCP